MNIEIISEIPFSELETMVKKVPLVKKDKTGREIFVYENANISFRDLSVNEVNPTTLYIIKKNFEFQRDLREALIKSYGIDSLHLEAAYEIKNEDGSIWTLTPPIIEVTERRVNFVAGKEEIKYNNTIKINIPIINDGAHRVYLALKEGERFTGMYISDPNQKFPFYSHPNQWDQIKLVDKVPTSKEEKKFYSREDCYALYRNFSNIGCGAPRGTSK